MNSNPEGMIYHCVYDTPSGLIFVPAKSIISRSRKQVLDAVALRQDRRQYNCRLNFREVLIII